MTNSIRLIAPITALLFFAGSVHAATTGVYFAGGCVENAGEPFCADGSNATEANVAELLGVDISLVSLIGEDEGAGGPGFAVTGVGTQSGTWSVSDTSITHIAFKSNGYFILGTRTALSGDWDNDTTAVGGWDISLVDCLASICGSARAYVDADFLTDDGDIAELSNVRAFSVVPIPAAVWLFGSALAGLGFIRRKKAA